MVSVNCLHLWHPHGDDDGAAAPGVTPISTVEEGAEAILNLARGGRG